VRVGPLAYAAEYLPEDEPLLAARANAADLGGTEPVLPAVGATLRFLACAVGAKTTVEIGTGCGSSGIWLLRGMRPGSTLTSVDTEPEYQRVARKAFQAAGFAQNQCRLILGRALDVLPRLSDGAYDMVFCDADPRDYQDYLSAALRLLRTGGVVAFNNALLAGSSGDDEGDVPAYDLASQIRADERLVPVLLPLGAATRLGHPTTDFRASPSLAASSAVSSTTSRPPPSSGTRMTMPRPSLVTSSGPSPVRGFIAAISHPLPPGPTASCRHRARLRTLEPASHNRFYLSPYYPVFRTRMVMIGHPGRPECTRRALFPGTPAPEKERGTGASRPAVSRGQCGWGCVARAGRPRGAPAAARPG
jgi:predicted O-methyltransferase YrrM